GSGSTRNAGLSAAHSCEVRLFYCGPPQSLTIRRKAVIMSTQGAATGNGHKTTSSTLTTQPFPASRKVFVAGTHAGVRVPMREVALTPTKSMNGGLPTLNEPLSVSDTPR